MYEIEHNPLKLYEELSYVTQKEHKVLQTLKDKIDYLENLQQSVNL